MCNSHVRRRLALGAEPISAARSRRALVENECVEVAVDVSNLAVTVSEVGVDFATCAGSLAIEPLRGIAGRDKARARREGFGKARRTNIRGCRKTAQGVYAAASALGFSTTARIA